MLVIVRLQFLAKEVCNLCSCLVSQAIRILGGGVAEIRMVTMASFLEIIAKDFRNSAHKMSCA